MAPPRSARGRSPEEPEQVLFVESQPAPGEIARVEGGEALHARRSLRMRTGNSVHLVDGRGSRYSGVVTQMGKDHLEVLVKGVEPVAVWPRRPVWVGAGVLRSTRMDFVVEKASELGVARLVPLLLTRSVARPHEDGAKLDRWHRLALESLKQSKRARLMELGGPSDLESFLGGLPDDRTIWVADPGGKSPVEAARDTGAGTLVLVVGPEGGLTPDEINVLTDSGASFVQLGGHRLRSETAVLTLLAAALAAVGEMGSGALEDGIDTEPFPL